MANRDDREDHREPLNENWTSGNALRSIALVGLLIAVFFLLSLVFPSPYDRTVQTQIEQPQPFTRAE